MRQAEVLGMHYGVMSDISESGNELRIQNMHHAFFDIEFLEIWLVYLYFPS